MTAQIYHLRDYKTREERQLEIDRLGLASVGAALNFPTDRELFEIEAGDQIEAYVSDTGDCA